MNALAGVVSLRLERIIVNFCSQLLTPCISENVFALFPLLNTSPVETFSIVRGILGRSVSVSSDSVKTRSRGLHHWNRWLTRSRFQAALQGPVAEIDLFDPLLLKGSVRVGTTVRMTLSFVSLYLLFSNCSLMQALVYGLIKKATTGSASQILLIFHDLAGTM